MISPGCLSQLSIKTRIETKLEVIARRMAFACLSQLSIKTRIETNTRIKPFPTLHQFESAIH